MKKQSKREKAAQNYVDSILPVMGGGLAWQCAVDAFKAGAAWQKRQDVAAVKALPTVDKELDYAPVYASDFQERAIDAIRKASK